MDRPITEGGKFANGASTAAFLQGLKEAPVAYKNVVKYELDAGPGERAVGKGKLQYPVKDAINIGTQGGRAENGRPLSCGMICVKEGSLVSRVLNYIPGVNAVAGLHDVFQVNLGEGVARTALNVPGMFVAAPATYAAFAGKALQPLSSGQIINLSISNSFDRDDDRGNAYSAAAIGSY